MELLGQHGVNNVNFRWRAENDPVSVPSRRELRTPYRTLLHIAALRRNADVVERLIRHRAEASREYYGMDPHDLAKSSTSDGCEDVIAAFAKFPECRAARPRELCTIFVGSYLS